MIDYSLGLRPVNPGDAESEKKVYASAQAREVLDIEDLAAQCPGEESRYGKVLVIE